MLGDEEVKGTIDVRGQGGEGDALTCAVTAN